ncbi:PASTA domain-containing protein [Parafannyhessea umbonata]|uniref:PASTA domain-containing protein n=1 Tax=Parafannyhessea umbonata TaxID=604330 RepID=A0A6N7WUG1_9ACTN|nr:PASTA domain-containing protein [Parafannyhessea umbonata]MCI6681367.1 PASTA domain-containing protein [Parafannyhessea umbonata]MST59691.1 PASTA domain-containing protein [Parafannyhessea umbonata]
MAADDARGDSAKPDTTADDARAPQVPEEGEARRPKHAAPPKAEPRPGTGQENAAQRRPEAEPETEAGPEAEPEHETGPEPEAGQELGDTGKIYVPKTEYTAPVKTPSELDARKRSVTLRAALLVVLAAILGSTLIVTRCFGLLSGTTVPSVVGYGEERARATLERKGLKVKVEEQETERVSDKGHVLSTEPAADESMGPGGTVTIVVGTVTQETQDAPNLVGLSKTDAANAIMQTNFFVQDDVMYAYSSTVPAGTVISQAPQAGSERIRGTAIDLIVSDGPNPAGTDGDHASESDKNTVTIPDVVGMTYQNAVTLLRGMGLKSARGKDVLDYGIPAGMVSSVSPAVGDEAEVGSTVTVYVAKSDE